MVIRLIHEIPSAAILSATQSAPENLAPDAPHSNRGPSCSCTARGLGLSAPDTATYYAWRNGITTAPAVTPAGLPSQVDRTEYRQPGHQPVTLHTVREGGHTIPGPKTARPRFLLGRTDHTFDTAGAINDFSGFPAR
jgi:polyhydroxybutyrate depolymerase